MIKRFCDVCGVEEKEEHNILPQNLEHLGCAIVLEMCPSCRKEFVKLVNDWGIKLRKQIDIFVKTHDKCDVKK